MNPELIRSNKPVCAHPGRYATDHQALRHASHCLAFHPPPSNPARRRGGCARGGVVDDSRLPTRRHPKHGVTAQATARQKRQRELVAKNPGDTCRASRRPQREHCLRQQTWARAWSTQHGAWIPACAGMTGFAPAMMGVAPAMTARNYKPKVASAPRPTRSTTGSAPLKSTTVVGSSVQAPTSTTPASWCSKRWRISAASLSGSVSLRTTTGR